MGEWDLGLGIGRVRATKTCEIRCPEPLLSLSLAALVGILRFNPAGMAPYWF